MVLWLCSHKRYFLEYYKQIDNASEVWDHGPLVFKAARAVGSFSHHVTLSLLPSPSLPVYNGPTQRNQGHLRTLFMVN